MTIRAALDAMPMPDLARSAAEQHVLGPIDAGRQIGAAADIGMHALDQAPVRGADLLGAGALGKTQHRERLLPRHVAARSARRRSSVAPVGPQPPVEISLEYPERI